MDRRARDGACREEEFSALIGFAGVSVIAELFLNLPWTGPVPGNKAPNVSMASRPLLSWRSSFLRMRQTAAVWHSWSTGQRSTGLPNSLSNGTSSTGEP
jgi:hypothetical protein